MLRAAAGTVATTLVFAVFSETVTDTALDPTGTDVAGYEVRRVLVIWILGLEQGGEVEKGLALDLAGVVVGSWVLSVCA